MDHQYILRIAINQFMGLFTVNAEGEEVNQIVGPCAAGKTSLVKAMEACIHGAKRVPSRAVTVGAEEGSVEIETTDLEFILILGADGSYKWACRGKDGSSYSQTTVDGLTSRLWLDPSLWARAPKQEKLAALMAFGGEAWEGKLQELTAALKKAEDVRLRVGQDYRAMGELPEEPEGVEPVDVVALSEELERIRQHNHNQELRKKALDDHQKQLEAKEADIRDCEAKLERLKKELHQHQQRRLDLPQPAEAEDPEPIKQQMASAREVNARAEAHQAWVRKAAEHRVKADKYREAEEHVQDIRDERVEHLQQLKLPVEGLRIDTDGNIFYNDLPLPEHVNEGEMTLIASELLMAQMEATNVVFRVLLVQRGESLDDLTFARLCRLARKYKVQVWLASGRMHGDGSEGRVIFLKQGRVVQKDPTAKNRGDQADPASAPEPLGLDFEPPAKKPAPRKRKG